MSSSLASSRQFGESAESALLQDFPAFRYVDDSEAPHYDAITTEPISASMELPFVGICILEVDQEVEIKSVAVVVTEGQCRGRFYFRRVQHEHLVEIGGMYLLAVCEPRRARNVIAAKVVPANIIDDLIGDSWIECDGRADYKQIAWSNFFEISEVEK